MKIDLGPSAIWAKTFSDGSAKPLIAHLLDVAAVAQMLQAINPRRLVREAAAVSVAPAALMALRVWMAALHDLGKCSVAFQAKSPDHWPGELWGPLTRRPDDPGHWRSTATLFWTKAIKAKLAAQMPEVELQSLKNLLAASAGHHGVPPVDADWRAPTRKAIGKVALPVAEEIFAQVCSIVPPPTDLVLTEEQAQQISWQASGLITVADWVGSDSDYFGPGPVEDLVEYYEAAQGTARRALAEKGLIPQPSTSVPGLTAVAPTITALRPMQAWVDRVALPEGPCLVIIEDATGSGKTEAALALASRMLDAGKGEGLYFALPTEATANAMFDRLEAAHRGLYADGACPSLVLAHGRAFLSEPFKRVRDAPPESSAAQCTAWIADHRRKAFFADVGAGTIDQAFLAILKKKHLTLRQYGLAGRILIVDEAHAYDAFMEEELSRLLALHAQSGGSAIVLSATLPQAKRAAMARAYCRSGTPCEAAFPLATLVSGGGVAEAPVAAAEPRCVAVERVPSAEEMHRQATEAARAGAAVLVLRNAVDEAIGSAAALREAGCATDLFHARFAHVDRAEIEDRVLRRFGKDGDTAARRGQVLVATQVVEQSLDVDFDVIFTDLAPVDLVIQRAGRLWRHARSGRPLAAPVLHVLSPDPAEARDPEWLGPVLGAGAYVYRHPGVMWRSARALFGARRIEAPAGLRDLIEAAYGPEAEPVPEGFEGKALDAEGIAQGHKAQAKFDTIALADGYGGLGVLSADQEIGTRLGDPVRTLRLARVEEGRIHPWAEGAQAWAKSELRVRATWVQGAAEPAELADAVKADWPEWEQGAGGPLLAVVAPDGAVRLEGGPYELRYDKALGLARVTC